MVIQSGGSKPHVVYIMRSLASYFPNIIRKLGGMVPRTTRTGGFSAHSEGRAIDIYLNAKRQPDKLLGDKLFVMFIEHAARLKVEHVIWDSTEWSPSSNEFKRISDSDGRGPHTDHVHVAFEDDNLDAVPTGIGQLIQNGPRRWLKLRGYQEWMDGVYGTAFDPKDPVNKERSMDERYSSYYKNKDIVPMALP
jgi:hypothetical protein